MSYLKDSTKFSQLSIPGTHDTMTAGYGGIVRPYVETQSRGLMTQLNAGVRFIDIRARVVEGKSFSIHHGAYYLGVMFGDVLNILQDFLRKNPGEVIFMRLKQEYSSESDEVFNKVLSSYLKKSYPFYYNYSSNSNPTLGNMRGKIVILRNFKTTSSYTNHNKLGLNYTDYKIQDNYQETNTNKKISLVKSLITYNNDNKGELATINYLSTSGGAANKTYADKINPVIADFIISAYVTIEDFLTFKYTTNAGILVADYISGDLLNRIIRLNDKYLSDMKDFYDNKHIYIRSIMNPEKIVDWSEYNNKAIIYQNKNGYNQKWLLKYDKTTDSYVIASAKNNNRMLKQEYNNVVVTHASSKGEIIYSYLAGLPSEFKWKIERLPNLNPNGIVVKITNLANGRVLDIVASTIDPSGDLCTYVDTNNNNQKFILSIE
jgi:1-phosphatidylinositol phosphodiesterase